MYGNGVKIGMETTTATHRQIQQVQAVGLTACIAVAAGAAAPGSVAWLFATTTRPAAGETALVSALPSPSNGLLRSAHSLVLSHRTEMLRKRGQKERRGTSLGKDLTNDNIEEKMGISAKPVADRNKNADFAQYLIKGLKGAADTDSDRIITAKEIFTYVSAKVSERTRKKQNPVMWGKFNDNMHILNWNPKRNTI